MVSRTILKALSRDPSFTGCAWLLGAAVVLYLVVAQGILFWRMQHNAYRDATSAQLGMFREDLKAYYEEKGDYPEDESAFRAFVRENSRLHDRDPMMDPWNSPYRFRRDSNSFEVCSYGPD